LVTAIAHRRRANREETPVAAYAHIYRMPVLFDFEKSSPQDSNQGQNSQIKIAK
ncbi:hypothetical protein AVEN_54244-1, partial [Araneus ventricosus]